MLGSYLRVGGCREECFILLLKVWVGVGRRNVVSFYLGVGGCREE